MIKNTSHSEWYTTAFWQTVYVLHDAGFCRDSCVCVCPGLIRIVINFPRWKESLESRVYGKVSYSFNYSFIIHFIISENLLYGRCHGAPITLIYSRCPEKPLASELVLVSCGHLQDPEIHLFAPLFPSLGLLQFPGCELIQIVTELGQEPSRISSLLGLRLCLDRKRSWSLSMRECCLLSGWKWSLMALGPGKEELPFSAQM